MPFAFSEMSENSEASENLENLDVAWKTKGCPVWAVPFFIFIIK